METITRREYLLKAIAARSPILRKDWWVKAFTIVDLKDEDENRLTPLAICTKTDGLYVIMPDVSKPVRIIDFVKGKPLFDPQEELEVTSNEFSNVGKSLLTKVGAALVNKVIIRPELENRFPYTNTKILTARQLETYPEALLRNKGDEIVENGIVKSITVADLVDFQDSLKFLESLSPFMTVSSTERSLVKPKGLEAYKQELFKKYEGQMNDPLVIIEIEKALTKFDKDWLEGDIVGENVLVKKSMLGRFRRNVMAGSKMDFVDDLDKDTLVLQATGDGMDPDPKEVVKLFNDLRVGIFARGGMTALAGWIYKILQRALTAIKIVNVPCSTTRGLIKFMSKEEVDFSLMREIKVDGKWKLLSTREEVNKIADKVVEMRSPMYCKSEGDTICYACLSHNYKNLPDGVTNIASGVSEALMVMFLKMNHASSASSLELDLDDLIN